MGVRPEYFMAATAGSPFYGPARRLDQMVKPGERLQTESLPAGWLRQVWDVWEGWTPATGVRGCRAGRSTCRHPKPVPPKPSPGRRGCA